MKQIKVWDYPVRIFHWLFVICFFGAFITSESERFTLLHLSFGYVGVMLIILRILWGFVGTRYARFSSLNINFQSIRAHILEFSKIDTKHSKGHNPLGATVMIGLVLLFFLTAASGYYTYNNNDIAEEVHEFFGNFMMLIVSIHILAAIIMSIYERQNLIISMINGKKYGDPKEGIENEHILVGLVFLFLAIIFMVLLISDQLPLLTQ